MAEAPRKVPCRGGFAGLELGHLHHNRALGAARETIAQPLTAVAIATTVHGLSDRDRVGIPRASWIRRLRDRDIDRLFLIFIVVPPEIEGKDFVVDIEEQLRVNAIVEGFLRDALNKITFGVVDNQPTVSADRKSVV